MSDILMTGGTGFIGRALVPVLLARDHRVIVVSRDSERARARFSEQLAAGAALEFVQGDPAYGGAWLDAIEGVHAVINLAGQGIGDQRWNARYKQLLRDSRVETTRYLVETMAKLEADARPAVLVSASGVDYYPFGVDLGAALAVDEDDEVDERTRPGSSFLARVCKRWEDEAVAAESLGVRVVRMRTGVVLGEGGALERLETPFRFFVGGRIGHGRQWFSWIHLRDAVRAYVLALEDDSVSGPLNLVAPEPVRASELAKAMGRALGRPSWLPVPAFALKAAVGEFSEYLLHGRRAIPRALLERGFDFSFPDLESALADLYDQESGS